MTAGTAASLSCFASCSDRQVSTSETADAAVANPVGRFLVRAEPEAAAGGPSEYRDPRDAHSVVVR
jgi:hypothetical protein